MSALGLSPACIPASRKDNTGTSALSLKTCYVVSIDVDLEAVLGCFFFLQVVGRKYIRIYKAEEARRLYPHTETMLQNASQVCMGPHGAERPTRSSHPQAYSFFCQVLFWR